MTLREFVEKLDSLGHADSLEVFVMDDSCNEPRLITTVEVMDEIESIDETYERGVVLS